MERKDENSGRLRRADGRAHLTQYGVAYRQLAASPSWDASMGYVVWSNVFMHERELGPLHFVFTMVVKSSCELRKNKNKLLGKRRIRCGLDSSCLVRG